MSEDKEKEKIKAEQEEMKEEFHEMELEKGYEQDEEFNESDE
jgi:hypothetical protein